MGSLSLSDDKVVNLAEYRKERNKGTPISPLMAFKPDHYYIYPEMGLMIHVLFLTDKSIKHSGQAIYVMEDQFGNFFADLVEEETCIGWHELEKEVFLHAVDENREPDPPEPQVG